MDSLQQTSKFLACNEDVLRLIIGSDILSKNDHRALCLAHSQLRQLTQPFLYSRINLTHWKDPIQNPAPHSISLLLSTILTRSDLAAYIRTIDLDSGRFDSGFNQPGARAYPMATHQVDLMILIPFVEKTWANIPCRDAWIAELRQGTMDAYIALLIVSVPRLVHLRLINDFFFDSLRIGDVLRFAILNSAPVLQHLQTVSLERWRWSLRDWPVQNTTSVLPFFYLPEVKEMSVWIDDPRNEDISWPTNSPPSLANLTSLKLYDIRELHLGQILSVAPKLRSLYWQWSFQPDYAHQYGTGRLDMNLVRLALETVKGTLTELNLEAEIGLAYQTDLDGRMCILSWPPTWLADFHQLKKLTIPLVFLTGLFITNPTEAGRRLNMSLPRNLEALAFRVDMLFNPLDNWDEIGTGYMPTIRSWIETASTYLPHLRKVQVEATDDHCDDCDHQVCCMQREMLKLAESAAIQLELLEFVNVPPL